MAKNLYEILGVSKDCNEKDLKTAYRKLSKKYHPDMQKGKSPSEVKEAEEKFKDVNHAYEVLSDPQKKQNYDTYGDENGNQNPFGGSGFDPFGGSGFDPFGGFNPFSGFSGFGSSRQPRNQVQPGRDIQMKIPVTIEDIFNGVKKVVKYKRDVRCLSCHGAGGTGQKTCPKCHGAGKIIHQSLIGRGTFSIQEEICPLCHGTGFYVENKCNHCGGSGFEKQEVKIEIEFNTGIQNGEYKVYSGKGSESKKSVGQNGNFIAIADYKFDTNKYQVDGLNVIEHIHVPYYKLLLGCSYTVNIPSGVSKTIKLKSCIKEGTVMRLSGEGLKRSDMNQRGDYFVCVHYLIPDNLTPNEKEHLEAINK